MTDETNEQRTLFDDPSIAADERELFGDSLRPTRAMFEAEGDYLHGWFVKVDRDVDLKTGYAPVDIVTVEGISGVLKGHTERVRKGALYAVAVLHATLKNRLSEAGPNEGERIAIRRDRDFISNVEGPSYGKRLVAWQVIMPDRPDPEPEPAAPAGRTRKAKADG